MFLKIKEFICDGEDLYCLDYFKDYKNRFIKCENGSNTRINIFCIEYKEQAEVYENLGLDLLYCDFNECYYIRANEKNMKRLVELLTKYNVEVVDFVILYSKSQEAYIDKIDIFINENFMLKYDNIDLDTFNIINEELKINNINLYFFNEVYFICQSSNNNFGLFNFENLNYLINDITTKLNDKLKEKNINLSVNFKSIDIKFDNGVKYINKLLYNFSIIRK